ncbi:MAG TPA: PAS domain S-box protein [Geminicoccaceae bacterium]|nr:PAS domain S-box protein [Geminicoccus sp.]HMU52487.1 PAS domain S-box protein [Geminicoccaceae bacterium]
MTDGTSEEARLRHAPSELLYRTILDSSTDHAIIATDRTGTVTLWNSGAARLFGWSEAEMLGHPAHMIFTVEDVAAGVPEAEMRTALAEGRAGDDRWQRRKDGTRFWANGSMVPLRTAVGEQLGFLKILTDRTEQRRMSETLRIAEDRLQLALGASSLVGVWDWDIPGETIVADAHLAGFYGIDPQRAASGAPVAEYAASIHPDERERIAAKTRRAIIGGSTFAEEFRVVGVDGTVRWIFARGRIHRGEDGRAERMPGVAVDVTERKRAEAWQHHLVELVDRVRDLGDAAQIAGVAAEILGRALGVARAGIARIDEGASAVVEADWTARSLSAALGSRRPDDCLELIESASHGGVLAITDVALDPRTRGSATRLGGLGTRALLHVPFLENGRLVALVFAHDDRPRLWSAEEIAFARDVGERARVYVERARAETHQRLLAGELQHRVKNTLAMVQAIVGQSLRGASSLDQARATVNDRLQVLARAYDSLMRPGQASAPIEAVVADSVRVCSGESGRVRLAGPPLALGAKPALTLSMALHELCTNAVKYGALSNDTGHVEVSWLVTQQVGEPRFRLDWSEHGGPAVAPPVSRGFGSRLIESGIAGELQGEARLVFEPGGVTWRLSAPLTMMTG